MSTHRERRMAKAERLDGWATKQQAKADALHARGQLYRGAAALSQPMSGRQIDKGRALISKEIAHSDKAADMRSRAEGIRAAAEQAIYSDDTDAVERLRERIEALEAERAAMKQANAEYRKAHKAELKELTPYGRDRALPFPSFKLTNLGGNIRRNKQRLAQLESEQ